MDDEDYREEVRDNILIEPGFPVTSVLSSLRDEQYTNNTENNRLEGNRTHELTCTDQEAVFSFFSSSCKTLPIKRKYAKSDVCLF